MSLGEETFLPVRLAFDRVAAVHAQPANNVSLHCTETRADLSNEGSKANITYRSRQKSRISALCELLEYWPHFDSRERLLDA